MGTILEISNWDQLVKARSTHDNLRILVTHIKNATTEATQIQIADYETNYVYFTGFVTILSADRFPTTAKFTNEQMIDIINSYGFQVRISPPTVLAEDVVTILTGLYQSGYRYIYKDYPCGAKYRTYGIYATDILQQRMSDLYLPQIPEFIDDEWGWCQPNMTYPIQDLIDTGTVNNGLPIR